MGFLLRRLFFLDGAGETLFEPARHANAAIPAAGREAAPALACPSGLSKAIACPSCNRR
jgi:hypothetical protein